MTIDSVYTSQVNNSILSSLHETVNQKTNSPVFANVLKARAISTGDVNLDAIFDAAGRKYDISPNLLKAVAKVESNFKADAVSKAGAMGIMQLMPGTAKHLGVDDPFDPVQNIMGGAKYLKEQLDRFDGDVQLALAAYNAGWAAVKKHGGIPPFRETQAYVPKVLSYMGGGEFPLGTLTYSGTKSTGVSDDPYLSSGLQDILSSLGLSDNDSTKGSTFDYNEALAQMLFIKLIEMQLTSSTESKDPVF